MGAPERQSEQSSHIHILARQCNKTNRPSYDYTKGKLGELVDIIIDSKASLFGMYATRLLTSFFQLTLSVSAVGVPPREVVDKLHAHGILYAVSPASSTTHDHFADV